MWNPGSTPATARWATAPAGRTLEWFRLLDRHFRLHGQRAGLATMAACLRACPDVFLPAGPSWALRPFLGVASVFARPVELVPAT